MITHRPILALSLFGVLGATCAGGRSIAVPTPAPEFPSLAPERWVRGNPTAMALLGGNVVLLEDWHRT